MDKSSTLIQIRDAYKINHDSYHIYYDFIK
jgi:hypothetical protein